MTQGNPKTKRGGGASGIAGGVRASTERHGARPLAGRSLEKKRRTLKAHPRVSGITKAENYKTKYKGEKSARERASEPSALRRRTLALPAPCRGVRFASSLPAPDRPWGDPGGRLPPALGAPALLHRRLAQAAPHTL